jgi:anthranilate synthase component 2
MILLIDNYDSFVHNLARYIGQLGFSRQVVRNDALSLEQIIALQPSHLVVSPGPCTPGEAGISMAAIQYFTGKIPILGVCLGHQAIAQVFGGKVCRAQQPMHGMSCLIQHQQQGILSGLSQPLRVARYHSLIVEKKQLPDVLMATAFSEQGEIMALQHRQYPVYGVQFHPESVLTEQGYDLLKNFVF